MISVIIPAFNEAGQIAHTIAKVREHAGEHHEIIVSDGGSTDSTAGIARSLGATVLSAPKGRAKQMNLAAQAAKYDILYFLHADSVPPKDFGKKVLVHVSGGHTAGCFRLKFDQQHWFLDANCWFTRFDVDAVRFGDQSLFVKKETFASIGGFREDLLMMEDQEIIGRIKKHGRFKVMDGAVITSARKYRDNGIYKMQAIFFMIWLLYYLGFSQRRLLMLHRRLIRNHKL